jgi:hypothetical protein
MSDYVTLKELADELGLDRSALRKYVLKNGISPVSVRTDNTRGQATLALTLVDADTVRELRRSQGFHGEPRAVENGNGWFYLIRIVPDLDPLRIKLGFALDVSARLDSHRCVSPMAELVKSWPCKRSWEAAAMASATRRGCRLIGGEVYQCESVEQVQHQTEGFFAVMPGECLQDALEMFLSDGEIAA